jgi:hypothetical protein
VTILKAEAGPGCLVTPPPGGFIYIYIFLKSEAPINFWPGYCKGWIAPFPATFWGNYPLNDINSLSKSFRLTPAPVQPLTAVCKELQTRGCDRTAESILSI